MPEPGFAPKKSLDFLGLCCEPELRMASDKIDQDWKDFCGCC